MGNNGSYEILDEEKNAIFSDEWIDHHFGFIVPDTIKLPSQKWISNMYSYYGDIPDEKKKIIFSAAMNRNNYNKYFCCTEGWNYKTFKEYKSDIDIIEYAIKKCPKVTETFTLFMPEREKILKSPHRKTVIKDNSFLILKWPTKTLDRSASMKIYVHKGAQCLLLREGFLFPPNTIIKIKKDENTIIGHIYSMDD